MSIITTVITNGGLATAVAVGSGGPAINITGFQIGSDIITPLDTMTGVYSGTVEGVSVYVGNSDQLSYEVINDNAVKYVITLDDTIGPFTMGNIGLFLNNGTMFSISALPITESKQAVTGNFRIFEIILVLSTLATISDYTVALDTNNSIPEVTNISDLPGADVAPYNTYLVDDIDEFNVPGLAIRFNSQWWYIPSSNGLTIINSGTTITLTYGGIYVLRLESAADFTFTLPSPTLGTKITIKDGAGNAATYSITLNAGSNTIDASSTYVISANYGSVAIIGDGTQWNII